ncbi:nucleocapsid protein [Nariva virus]|uniref:Nucleocapsid n=1 Tax=Nariva virus TaxID=590647 RepID=B8XH58_9MONO|nr:nucleocapsid protein [Nariva virus]ACL97353.1 nucleocapsid protein [Nariva virus]
MAGVLSALKDFKEAKLCIKTDKIAKGAITAIKRKVAVIVPGQEGSKPRWKLLKMLLGVIWSDEASPSVITGALLSMIALMSENPASMVRRLCTDPDLSITIVEFTLNAEGEPVFASRGVNYQEQMAQYMRMANNPPGRAQNDVPFEDEDAWEQDDIPMDEFMVANMTVQIQLWTLLIKAVTAPDTARDGELRRWIKYAQQRRVVSFYKLNTIWLNITRGHLAADLSVRRFMVRTLIEIQRMGGNKGRLLEAIADIGNYIEESGLAGFHLTIRYGIETRYSALALNEFQGDLATIERLMKMYLEMGPSAPYMVLLEESVQTKFAPGNYPLLWSYAMGVGAALDRAMANLNFNRPYLDHGLFRLGQRVVRQMEGSVDQHMARELGMTSEDHGRLQRMIQGMGTRGAGDIDEYQQGEFQVASLDDDEPKSGQSAKQVQSQRPTLLRTPIQQHSNTAAETGEDEDDADDFAAAIQAAFDYDPPTNRPMTPHASLPERPTGYRGPTRVLSHPDLMRYNDQELMR